MQRAAIGEGDVVGDVDELRDRAQANGAQLALQPFGRGSVLYAFYVAPDEQRTGFRIAIREVERHLDGRVEAALDLLGVERLQRAEALRREIARDAVDAQRIGAVGRDLDIDHRVIEAQRLHGGRAHRPVTLDFDDAVVLVRDEQLTLRAQHRLGFDAADGGGREHRTRCRNGDPGQCDDRRDAGARIGGTADNLLGAVLRLHHALAQLVGIGVLLCQRDMRHGEVGKQLRLVGDFFHFESDADQALADFIQGGVGVEIFLEPGEGEFHDRPPASVGTCSALNP